MTPGWYGKPTGWHAAIRRLGESVPWCAIARELAELGYHRANRLLMLIATVNLASTAQKSLWTETEDCSRTARACAQEKASSSCAFMIFSHDWGVFESESVPYHIEDWFQHFIYWNVLISDHDFRKDQHVLPKRLTFQAQVSSRLKKQLTPSYCGASRNGHGFQVRDAPSGHAGGKTELWPKAGDFSRSESCRQVYFSMNG